MAANSYYSSLPFTQDEQQQHLLSHAHSSPAILSGSSTEKSPPLKPLRLVTNMEKKRQSLQNFEDFEAVKKAEIEDKRLKSRIRRLRFVSRLLALLISIAVFVPITLTLHKFLTTKDIYHSVTHDDGSTISRTAWAADSKVWPTWMYFLVAGIAVLLNLVILFAYKFGVEHANRAAVVATTFSWVVMVGHLVLWGVAAGLYRKEKDVKDLWGWTCSPAARAIQKEFAGEVDFDMYCNVQSISWYVGLVQVAAAGLTIVIYALVVMRRKTKKNVKRRSIGFEPPR